MALVVETGTGRADAESYCTVATADSRHAAFGNTAWAALSTDAKEQALRRATAYMVQAYSGRWSGTRLFDTQALDWPRFDARAHGWVISSDLVPSAVINACADVALKASTETLAPDLERAVVREKIGPIETEYSSVSPQAKRFRAIDMALAPYLQGSSATARLVRA